MGCLKLTYRNETSPLRVSRELENDVVNWQVWMSKNTFKQHKGVIVAQNGGSPFGTGQDLISTGPFTGSMADRSTYFEGVRVYTTEVGAIGRGAAGTLPGVGIFVNSKDKYNVNLLRHEFGHILQARKWGNDFFYGTIVPVSLMSADAANNGSFDHQSTWTEWTANLLSWRYFGKPANWDMNSYPIYPVQHSSMLAYPPKSINLKD